MIDINNLVSEVNDGELRVRNIAPHTGGDLKFHDSLSNMLIDGYENRGGTEEWYNAPRPYIANSNDELENNEEVQKAIDRGLTRQGLKKVK